MSVDDFWGVPPREIPGWLQTGDTNGKKFACWVQHSDGSNCSIQRAALAERYWLVIDGNYHGNYPTPELAAGAAAKIIEDAI